MGEEDGRLSWSSELDTEKASTANAAPVLSVTPVFVIVKTLRVE